MRRFTGAEEGCAGLIEYANLDLIRDLAEAQDGIAAPVPARDPGAIKRNALMAYLLSLFTALSK